jgi:hypothetical protein
LAETSPGTHRARTRFPGDSVDERHGRDRNGKAAYGADPSRGTGTRLAGLLHHGASEVGLIVLVLVAGADDAPVPAPACGTLP